MKKISLFLSFLILVAFSFTACQKDINLKDKKEWADKSDYDKDKADFDKEDTIENCEWNEATEASGPEFKKYVVEDLVFADDCDCIEKGIEKFLKNGQTKYLIYYGVKECVGYGYKVTCVDGDCEKEESTKCKFLQDCDGEG